MNARFAGTLASIAASMWCLAGCLETDEGLDDQEGSQTLAICNPDIDPECPPRPEFPNLVPESINGSFCVGDFNGLVIRIRNRGRETAGATRARIDYGSASFEKATPSLAPGDAAEVVMPSPPSTCFRPDCFFTITADSPGVIRESSETDNAVVGVCPG